MVNECVDQMVAISPLKGLMKKNKKLPEKDTPEK